MADPIFTLAPFSDEMNTDLWPKWSADHADVDTVTAQGNAIVNDIIANAPLVGGKANTLIDVRTQYLTVGAYTIGRGWHIENPGSDDVDQTAIHHIYVIGVNRTEFLFDDESIVAIPTNNYATYDADNVHRGIQVHTEEFRLFVRIQEVNAWPPRRAVPIMAYEPTTYPELDDGDPVDISQEEYDNYFLENSHLNLGS